MTSTPSATEPTTGTPSRAGVPTAAIVALVVGVIALLAFAAVTVWATAHGGSNITGWPLWEGISPRPR